MVKTLLCNFVLASVLFSSASAQIRYTVTDLGANFDPSAINNSGTVAGFRKHISPELYYDAYIWQDKNLSVFYHTGRVTSISSSGVVATAGKYGGLISAGQFTPQPSDYLPWSINSQGQVLEYTLFDNRLSGIYVNTVGVRSLVTDDPLYRPYLINGSGQVIITDNYNRPFLWQDGSITPITLPQPGGIMAINDRGDLAAYVATGGGQLCFGSETVLIPFWPEGINNLGSAVGRGLGVAYLYQDGQSLDLNTLIDPALGWNLGIAKVISDNGWIAGLGTNPQGQSSAFLLMPIPEPATLSLMAISLLFVRKKLTKNR